MKLRRDAVVAAAAILAGVAAVFGAAYGWSLSAVVAMVGFGLIAAVLSWRP